MLGEPGTTRRQLSPPPRRRQTRDRRCLGQLHDMRLVGANWRSSGFTFVIWSILRRTCRDKIELQGARPAVALKRHARGSPSEISIMNDRNETVNDSTPAQRPLLGAALQPFHRSSAEKAFGLTGKFPTEPLRPRVDRRRIAVTTTSQCRRATFSAFFQLDLS